MEAVTRHVTRCLIAGIVALLPIGGLVLAVVYIEDMIAGSFSDSPWYFPGLGILAAGILVYVIGLVVTSVLGRWLWKRVDRLLHNLPLLGRLYATLKQILGYGEGEGALFQEAVLVKSPQTDGEEIGLVTARSQDAEGKSQLTVFIPGAPTPTMGRLVLISAGETRPLNRPVSDALKSLVSIGLTPPMTAEATPPQA
ncbi:MAG: DUF502 domain-containing protein [Phycisphaerae bacterium]|nr:DUF502 domain-containing protein [Phycisphaerae bacterium]